MVQKTLNKLLDNNRAWSAAIHAEKPEFFPSLKAQQNPEYLWIGCSDSRVPANQIVGLLPGEIFVHRNVANVVVHTDLNCLSVIQYAVDVLKVRHILVVGHYGCGGVCAALTGRSLGLADNWLRHVQDVEKKHASVFAQAQAEKHWDALCCLNVIEQVANVSETTILRDAWARGEDITVHGWIYSLHDGLVNDLGVSISSTGDIKTVRDDAVEAVYTHMVSADGMCQHSHI